ncbi:hypothetical protein ACWDA3_61155, partial [Nonomuraea rubra]
MLEDAKPVFGPAQDWGRIRQWDGSQHRAFEELCFQLRDPVPEGWKTIKTAAPDGGLEWYDQGPGGVVHGWQVKFVGSVDDLIPQARGSAETVGSNRAHRNVRKLTFLAPIDLPDPTPVTRSGRPRRGARQRWTEAVKDWSKLPGLQDVEIDFLGAGELLERLNRPGNEGRRWFFFEERALGPAWCRQQFEHAERIANDRYTPERHLALPLERTIDGLVLTQRFRGALSTRASAACESVTQVQMQWRAWLDRHQPPAGRQDTIPATGAAVGDQLRSTLNAMVDRAATVAVALRDDLKDLHPGRGLAAAALAALAETGADLLRQFQLEVRPVVSVLADREPKANSPQEADLDADALVMAAPDPPGPAASLRHLIEDHGPVTHAQAALNRLADLLSSDRSVVAEAGAWLLLGGPGQGKTHLLLDAVRRVIDAGGVAVPVFGEQLTGDDPLSEIARVLGLGDLPHEMFLQALDAAGAVSGTRFLLVVDALNDCDEPRRWKIQLPAMLSRLAAYDHVAVVFSCRTTMNDVVLPADLDHLGLPVTHHPGFGGREAQGLEQYLKDIPQALPRTPLLQSSFSNPLFVKLYADMLRQWAASSDVGPVVLSGSHHRSEVFGAFLDSRAAAICDQLGLDPVARPVHQAVRALAERMAETGYEVLSREEARQIVDAFAPHATAWPRTMLGQLISRGVLATDRYYRRGEDPDAGVAFPYQAFSDDLVVRAAFDHHRPELTTLAEGTPLPEGSALRGWLQGASPNLREAATVIMPELVGVELIDALWPADSPTDHATDREEDTRNSDRLQRHGLFRALAATLPLRAGSTVTDRTQALLEEAEVAFGLSRVVWDAMIAVSTESGHPLNAGYLHTALLSLTATQRDTTWGIYAHDAYFRVGPLHRLLRWAEQLPTPQRLLPGQAMAQPALRPRRAGTRAAPTDRVDELPGEVAELAATVLVWTLTSSNRFLRDRATKALIQLLLGFPGVLSRLLGRYLRDQVEQVDDLYLFARLLLVAEGVMLRTGHAQSAALAPVAQQIHELVYADAASPAHVSRNVMLCDAAQGIMAAAHRLGLISGSDVAVTGHPHPHPVPECGEAPAEDEFDRRFPREADTSDSPTPWASLRSSLDTRFGDFGRYRITQSVTRFSRLPVHRPRPADKALRRQQPPELDSDRVAAFCASLPAAAQHVVGSPAAVLRLLRKPWLARRVLDEDQNRLLLQCLVPAPLDEQLFDAEQDPRWASRWILARVAEFGWTPELFGDFDRSRRGRFGYNRSSHKAERIGKKYQWMALYDLLERLANHYHPMRQWEQHGEPYRGGWELVLQPDFVMFEPTPPVVTGSCASLMSAATLGP